MINRYYMINDKQIGVNIFVLINAKNIDDPAAINIKSYLKRNHFPKPITLVLFCVETF